jgi:hypothetical protein
MTIDGLVTQFEEIGLRDFSSKVQMRIMLRVLGEQVSEIRLSGNRRLCDATDFAELLLTLADRMHMPKAESWKHISVHLYCQLCGHVHQNAGECGVSMGGAGACDCKAEVTA